ncbi:dephospho-CoA kinase [Chitinimonas sp.]|uniref:dephospho-CoA kinase n=1 Tax=Chitinimonas sp. TaxID=1934313 RepID=UPI002F920B34
MRVVGLTGGIGSGKSTVAALFQGLGVPLIDTDAIAHSLSAPGQAGAQAVAALFGVDYLDASGAIDRPRLRQRVFQDDAARRSLEQALHPLIRQAAMAALTTLPASTPYCLLAVPLLFETGAYADVIDQAWVVDCPEALQIARVKARSGMSEAEIRAIMAKQLTREARLAQADAIIENDGDVSQLTERVEELHRKYMQAPE